MSKKLTDLGEIVHGDRERFTTADEAGVSTVVIRDVNGDPEPDASLDGWTLRWTARAVSSLGPVLIALSTLSGGVEIVDPGERLVRVNLKPSDYAQVPLVRTELVWDLEGYPSGNAEEVHTLDRGKLAIVPGSSR